MKKDLSKKSRYLSKLLRHKPEDLVMSKNGYVKVVDILSKLNISFEDLKQIVKSNDKKRFSFNEDLTMIRANQGHSINVDIELEKLDRKHFLGKNITYLYHGTIKENLPTIKKQGLKKMNRRHVHLSVDKETATNVGKRHGKNLFIIEVKWKSLILEQNIYISKNGVYLTEDIDPKHLNNI